MFHLNEQKLLYRLKNKNEINNIYITYPREKENSLQEKITHINTVAWKYFTNFFV